MKVALIGPLCKDVNVVNGKEHSQMGSPLYYTGKALHALGADVTLFVSYGVEDDAWAKRNLKGIKIIHIPAEGTINSRNEYVTNETRNQFVNYFTNRVELHHLTDMGDYDYIIYGPLYAENLSLEIFQELSKTKAIKALDNFGLFRYPAKPSPVWKNPEKLVQASKYLDYLFLDEKEVLFGTQKKTIPEAAKVFLDQGVKVVAVTYGSQGSEIFTENKTMKIPAFPPTKLVDPTGAGDTYMAGFIKGMELFNDIEKAGHFAAMTATCCIEKAGAFDKTTEHVHERLGTISKLFAKSL
ncbi:PfkB family carbohydrate kinase [Nanoarchaeota archaeon]